MNILLAVIGRMKPGPERELFEHYTRYAGWKITVKEYEVKQKLEPVARKAAEGELLLTAVKDAEHVILLDEKGTDITSRAFATCLQQSAYNGTRALAFVIGGADGLHASLHVRAQESISFGRVTWPHLLVRILLAEQIYRAHTILKGHPYHREG